MVAMVAPSVGMLLGTDGVQTNISDFLRPQTALKTGNNVNMIKRGIITNRYAGWVRQRNTDFNSGAQFLDFSNFVDSSGNNTLIFQCGDTIYSYDGAIETAMQGSLSTTNPPCFRMFAPTNTGTTTMIYCNGSDQPVKFTGIGAASGVPLQLNGGNYPQTLLSPLPARTYSAPAFCEPFLDRMVYAGFATGSTSAFDILITNSGTAETCTESSPALIATDGGVFTANPALGPITGLKAFRLTNTDNVQVLLIAQLYGVSIITGTNAYEFSCYTLTTEYGIPSNRTWVPIMNDLWYLADDGIRRFGTLVQNSNLINAAESFLVQDVMNTIEPTQAQWAHMTHMRIYKEITLWFPTTGGSQCNQGLVLNYNNDASRNPVTISPIFFTKDGTEVACATVFKNNFYGGGYTGLLQQHYTGNLYDNIPVLWQILGALIKPQSNRNSLSLDNAVVLTEGASQSFLVNAYSYQHVNNTLIRQQLLPANYAINAIIGTGNLTILGIWLLGISGFAQSGPKRHTLPFQGYAPMWEIQMSGNLATHTIDWLGTEYQTKEGGPNA